MSDSHMAGMELIPEDNVGSATDADRPRPIKQTELGKDLRNTQTTTRLAEIKQDSEQRGEAG